MGVGLVAGVPPALLALAVFMGSYPWFGTTVAVSCLGAGAVIGATIGRRLAARPDPLGVLIVAAIAVVVGDLIAAPMLALETGPVDLVGFLAGGLIVLGIPAYFFLSFPGLILGIVIARRLMPSRV